MSARRKSKGTAPVPVAQPGVSPEDLGETPRPAGRRPALPETVNPHSILLSYQRDWVDDGARFKIGLWARQTGKSFSTQAEAVADCLARKTTWDAEHGRTAGDRGHAQGPGMGGGL